MYKDFEIILNRAYMIGADVLMIANQCPVVIIDNHYYVGIPDTVREIKYRRNSWSQQEQEEPNSDGVIFDFGSLLHKITKTYKNSMGRSWVKSLTFYGGASLVKLEGLIYNCFGDTLDLSNLSLSNLVGLSYLTCDSKFYSIVIDGWTCEQALMAKSLFVNTRIENLHIRNCRLGNLSSLLNMKVNLRGIISYPTDLFIENLEINLPSALDKNMGLWVLDLGLCSCYSNISIRNLRIQGKCYDFIKNIPNMVSDAYDAHYRVCIELANSSVTFG